MEETKLKEEHEDLKLQIEKRKKIMADDKEVYNIIKQETKTLKTKHAVPRRSEIVGEEENLTDEDLLANDRYASFPLIYLVNPCFLIIWHL